MGCRRERAGIGGIGAVPWVWLLAVAAWVGCTSISSTPGAEGGGEGGAFSGAGAVPGSAGSLTTGGAVPSLVPGESGRAGQGAAGAVTTSTGGAGRTPSATDGGQSPGSDAGHAGEAALVEPKAPLGASCGDDAECESGFCSDFVCCASRCGEVCAQCDSPSAPGTCTAVAHDDGCSALACPASSECRSYVGTDLFRNCEDIGQCRTDPECTASETMAGTTCGDGAGRCDGSGECVVQNKGALGASCTAASECASNFCVDGVCCESACDGACQACRAETGRCDVVPADDNACPAVDCNYDAQCLSAGTAGNITTNRCRSLGQCKTRPDCGAQFRSARTPCGVSPQQCDGAGACITPTVTCGDSECGAVSSACCYTWTDGQLATACGAPASCPSTAVRVPDGQTYRTPVTCDEQSDCPTGQLCCLTSMPSESRISCLPAASCNQTSGADTYSQVCQAPGSNDTCRRGTCSGEYPLRFPGWLFCSWE